MIRAIIIDDEKPARDLVRAYAEQDAELNIVGECENGFQAFKEIQEHKPDLIFLDVQMPKLNGFELLELIDDPPVVIFSTAFDEYAVKAFEKSAIDYLLKPYSRDRFMEAVSKAKVRVNQSEDVVSKAIESTDYIIERFAVRQGARIIILALDEIEMIEAQDDYVAIHCDDGKKYLKQLTMKKLENALPINQFVRVHRSFIVNMDKIKRLEALSKDSFVIKLATGKQASVSRAGYNRLKDKLEL